MKSYEAYKEAVDSYNDIVSTGLKHGHLNGVFELEKALPRDIIYIDSWQSHMAKMSAKLDLICT